MADSFAGIVEAHTLLRDEFPFVALRRKGKFQHAKRIGIAYLTVRYSEAQQCVAFTPSAYRDLAYPTLLVQVSVGILGSESFVGMLVAGKH